MHRWTNSGPGDGPLTRCTGVPASDRGSSSTAALITQQCGAAFHVAGIHQLVGSHGGLDRGVLAMAVNEQLGGAVDIDVVSRQSEMNMRSEHHACLH